MQFQMWNTCLKCLWVYHNFSRCKFRKVFTVFFSEHKPLKPGNPQFVSRNQSHLLKGLFPWILYKYEEDFSLVMGKPNHVNAYHPWDCFYFPHWMHKNPALWLDIHQSHGSYEEDLSSFICPFFCNESSNSTISIRFSDLCGQVRVRCRLGGSVQGAWNKGPYRGGGGMIPDPPAVQEASVFLKVISSYLLMVQKSATRNHSHVGWKKTTKFFVKVRYSTNLTVNDQSSKIIKSESDANPFMAIPLKRISQGFTCGDGGDVGMPGYIFLNSSENDVKVEVGKDPTLRNST